MSVPALKWILDPPPKPDGSWSVLDPDSHSVVATFLNEQQARLIAAAPFLLAKMHAIADIAEPRSVLEDLARQAIAVAEGHR